MKQTVLIVAAIALCALALPTGSAAQTLVTDSNAAIYEGSRLSYIVAAPPGFELELAESQVEDYSFAFIPEGESFSEATMHVGITIYTLVDSVRNLGPAEEFIALDTASMRKHFGESLTIRPVDSVMNGSNVSMTTFYLEDKTRFMPNVMVAYFDGSEELVIFELVITRDFPRFLAEDTFMQTLKNFKTLVQGELSQKSD
ncbi:hypothetical protein GF356_08815 [candidate division GN15 bacterium]|nr:hypothetical protein [candidate division GN15 bacterium]